jgi:hypothetical protein
MIGLKQSKAKATPKTKVNTSSSATPVGVTIALQRKQKGLKEQPQGIFAATLSRSESPSSSSRAGSSSKSNSTTKKTLSSPSPTWRIFVEGATLYAVCLILPTALGFFLRFYDDPSWWQRKVVLDVYQEANWSSFVYDQTAYYLCPSHESTVVNLLGLDAYHQWWCPAQAGPGAYGKNSTTFNVLSPDADWTDFGMVALLSITLAVIRFIIVGQLVHPYQDGTKLEALVRCKSIHLLGSEYSATLTPHGTPRPSLILTTTSLAARHNEHQDGVRVGTPVTTTTTTHAAQQASSLVISSLAHGSATNNNPRRGYSQDHLQENDYGLGLDEQSDCGSASSAAAAAVTPSYVPSSADTAAASGWMTPPRRQHADNNDDDYAIMQSMQQLSQQLDDSPGSVTHEEALPAVVSSGRLYAAPRYATAVFRLVYCTTTVILALYWFRDANFWPWYVGGHGATQKCWDLSGGLTLGMDSDFDQRNAALRQYFLWQASYHWHSGAFHLMSMMILLLHPKHYEQRRFLSLKTTTSAYVRSLVQHVLSLALIATVYVFSSLRRLAAIGMFAFDVSSWFLHLLQSCINAPDGSRWKKPTTVARIRSWLVIPSFVVARFMIWPAVWYSLQVESKQWLVQLENMLMPGSALAMRCIFHFWMILLMGSTVVYFRRLLDHPHLQRILRQAEYDQAKHDD